MSLESSDLVGIPLVQKTISRPSVFLGGVEDHGHGVVVEVRRVVLGLDAEVSVGVGDVGVGIEGVGVLDGWVESPNMDDEGAPVPNGCGLGGDEGEAREVGEEGR